MATAIRALTISFTALAGFAIAALLGFSADLLSGSLLGEQFAVYWNQTRPDDQYTVTVLPGQTSTGVSCGNYKAPLAWQNPRSLLDVNDDTFVSPIDALLVIDELLTPDSSRLWPLDRHRPGTSPPSVDKQPLRDYLAELRRHGRWNGEAPGPRLPPEVVHATSERYLEAYRLLTGSPLEVA